MVIKRTQEAAASRAARLAQQSSNPNYLKDSARSPLRQVAAGGQSSVSQIIHHGFDPSIENIRNLEKGLIH